MILSEREYYLAANRFIIDIVKSYDIETHNRLVELLCNEMKEIYKKIKKITQNA